MDFWRVNGAGYDLHGFRVRAVAAWIIDVRAPRHEQPMPVEQSICRKWLGEIVIQIDHDFGDGLFGRSSPSAVGGKAELPPD